MSYAAPFHVDNGVLLLITPFMEHPLQVPPSPAPPPFKELPLQVLVPPFFPFLLLEKKQLLPPPYYTAPTSCTSPHPQIQIKLPHPNYFGKLYNNKDDYRQGTVLSVL